MNKKKTVIIVGAGPAGLTAAYEFLKHTDIKPVVFEASKDIGGISKTVNYKGNFIDIGGHRFFSKSDRVMEWWKNILPVQGGKDSEQFFGINSNGPDPDKVNRVMLVRSRLSRIYFIRKFFAYPISLTFNTIRNLGLIRLIRIAFSYLYIKIFPLKNENSLEDFFINRFGKELYKIFFRDYTEKVWGIACSKIKAEWGSQRIKGLSVSEAFKHAIKKIIGKDKTVDQKGTETSLIERFLYPKYGPGQMWKEVARQVEEMGGEILINNKVIGFKKIDERIISVKVLDEKSKTKTYSADYFISTMPVKELIKSISPQAPEKVLSVANGLIYRDFITVGLLMDKLLLKNQTGNDENNNLISDNWIYIQEPDVKLGRLQIFNNWSPYMVKDGSKVWMGLEYFCDEGDDLWIMSDDEIKELAVNELASIGIIDRKDVNDSVLIRMLKTYPAYFGTYDEFYFIREYTDRIENLFLIGRNGMHKYNNQDHSMLAAMTTVENIKTGNKNKDNIWSVNTEKDYHEEKR